MPTSASRPLLVLDVGGVLLTDPMPILFDRLAEAGGRPRNEIYGFYQANLRNRFWSGEIGESDLWSGLLPASGLGLDEEPKWRAAVVEWQTPLPAIDRLAGWAARADIEILSNHRTAWIRPLLEAAGVTLPAVGEEGSGLIRRALVSEETRLVKPDADAFVAALQIAPRDGRVIFADDQRPNVAAAPIVGLPSILVDPDGNWMAEIDRWLDAADA